MPVERASEKLENEAMPIHDGQWENYEEALQELV